MEGYSCRPLDYAKIYESIYENRDNYNPIQFQPDLCTDGEKGLEYFDVPWVRSLKLSLSIFNESFWNCRVVYGIMVALFGNLFSYICQLPWHLPELA